MKTETKRGLLRVLILLLATGSAGAAEAKPADVCLKVTQTDPLSGYEETHHPELVGTTGRLNRIAWIHTAHGQYTHSMKGRTVDWWDVTLGGKRYVITAETNYGTVPGTIVTSDPAPYRWERINWSRRPLRKGDKLDPRVTGVAVEAGPLANLSLDTTECTRP